VELIFCIGWSWADGKRVLHNMASATAVYKTADGSVDELCARAEIFILSTSSLLIRKLLSRYAMRLTLLAHLFQVGNFFKIKDEPICHFFPDDPIV
jgi:hypothetical protein